MIVDEDTGEAVVCPICYAEEYWSCGHLVASFDRNFCECRGGAIYGRLNEFSSAIEIKFLQNLKRGLNPYLKISSLSELWQEARSNYIPGEDVFLDGDILQRGLIELLENSGAHEIPGSVIEPGGPGATSSMSILFANNPPDTINLALSKLLP